MESNFKNYKDHFTEDVKQVDHLEDILQTVTNKFVMLIEQL